jgi:H+/gluconate symporter-like permease
VFFGVTILIVFAVLAILMMTQKIHTIVAVFILTMATALLAGIPVKGTDGILASVIEAGAARLASAIIALVMGGWLGQIMNRTGITESTIRFAAELGGDNKYVLSMVLAAGTALVFTAVGGLGALILVGSMVLPILTSVGIPPLESACVFLLGFATGLPVNIQNWAYFSTLTGVPLDQVRNFAFVLVGLTACATVLFILVELRKTGSRSYFSTSPVQAEASAGKPPARVPFYAVLTPIVPLVLVMAFKWPITPALLTGIVYALVTTRPKAPFDVLVRTAHEGVENAAPAVLLLIVIGMLLKAVMHPVVTAGLEGFLKAVIPSTRMGYILFFAILAPLSLYRGPLNLFGLGSGLAAVIIGTGSLSPTATMGAFLAMERLQVAGDPTNTQNVWTANFVGVDVNQVTKKLLPYLWAVAAVSAACSGLMFF